jgi:hypothetical protein
LRGRRFRVTGLRRPSCFEDALAHRRRMMDGRSMTDQTRRWLLKGMLLAGAVAVDAAPAWARSINVPWYGQKNSSDCGRAVLASLAARRGGSAEAAYRKLPEPTDPRGYSISDMRRYGSRVGVGLSVSAPGGVVIAGNCGGGPAITAHMTRLSRAVAGGRPVVVPVSSGFGSGHFLVLVGTSGDGFTVLDPASLGLRSMSGEQLASSMCGYGYLALIAS